jgi:glycerol-3-phosphate dehydrogenase
MESIDVVVIGAGLIGAAIARELIAAGYQTAVVERAGGPAQGVSCTNAGILASGFDRPAGGLEASLIRAGAARWPALFKTLEVPYRRTGALILASSAQDVGLFPAILRNAEVLGIAIEPLDSKRLRELEPGAGGRAALHVPEEAITDPVEVTRRLLSTVPVHYHAHVLAVEQRVSEAALVRLEHSAIAARVVINCAGLFADEIAADGSFRIAPRRGDFVAYAPPDPPVLRTILRPAVRDRGVLVFPTLYGYVCAGPSSVDQDDKNDWAPRGLREVRAAGARLLPALSALQPVDAWAGLRPAGVPHDYCIEWSARVTCMLNVGAIRGSGLSACLGIASYVRGLLAERDVKPRGPQLAVTPGEFDSPRPWWERHNSERSVNRRAAGAAEQID